MPAGPPGQKRQIHCTEVARISEVFLTESVDCIWNSFYKSIVENKNDKKWTSDKR